MTILKCPICGEPLKMITEGVTSEDGVTLNWYSYGCPKDSEHLKLFLTTDETELQKNINALTEYATKVEESNYRLQDLVKSDDDVSKLFDAESVTDIDADYATSFKLPEAKKTKTKQDILKEIIDKADRHLTVQEIAVAIYRLKDKDERFKKLYESLLVLNSETGDFSAVTGLDRLSSLLYGMGTTHGLSYYTDGTYGFPENTD